MPEFKDIKDRVEIQVTTEGLRIELVDSIDEELLRASAAPT